MASDILIVDDEADIRDLVAGILDDEGFSTRTARDSVTMSIRAIPATSTQTKMSNGSTTVPSG